jgi:ribonuclease BN (tRNA processing enzyme)
MHDGGPPSGARHLKASEAGRLALEAGSKRLAITHVPPGCDPALHQQEAAAAFGRAVEYCASGVTLTI